MRGFSVASKPISLLNFPLWRTVIIIIISIPIIIVRSRKKATAAAGPTTTIHFIDPFTLGREETYVAGSKCASHHLSSERILKFSQILLHIPFRNLKEIPILIFVCNLE